MWDSGTKRSSALTGAIAARIEAGNNAGKNPADVVGIKDTSVSKKTE